MTRPFAVGALQADDRRGVRCQRRRRWRLDARRRRPHGTDGEESVRRRRIRSHRGVAAASPVGTAGAIPASQRGVQPRRRPGHVTSPQADHRRSQPGGRIRLARCWVLNNRRFRQRCRPTLVPLASQRMTRIRGNDGDTRALPVRRSDQANDTISPCWSLVSSSPSPSDAVAPTGGLIGPTVASVLAFGRGVVPRLPRRCAWCPALRPTCDPSSALGSPVLSGTTPTMYCRARHGLGHEPSDRPSGVRDKAAGTVLRCSGVVTVRGAVGTQCSAHGGCASPLARSNRRYVMSCGRMEPSRHQ